VKAMNKTIEHGLVEHWSLCSDAIEMYTAAMLRDKFLTFDAKGRCIERYAIYVHEKEKRWKLNVQRVGDGSRCSFEGTIKGIYRFPTMGIPNSLNDYNRDISMLIIPEAPNYPYIDWGFYDAKKHHLIWVQCTIEEKVKSHIRKFNALE